MSARVCARVSKCSGRAETHTRERRRTFERDVDVLGRDDLARDDLLVLAQVERREVDAELAERLLGLCLGLFALALGRVHLVHDDLQCSGAECQLSSKQVRGSTQGESSAP